MYELKNYILAALIAPWVAAFHAGLFLFWRWITHDSLSAIAATLITMTLLWSLIIKILEAYQRKVKHGKQ
jgi:hypothetical protein